MGQQSNRMEVAEVVGSNIKTEPQQQVVDLGGEDESGVVEYGEEEEYQYGGQDYHYQEDLHQGMGEAGAAGPDRSILLKYIQQGQEGLYACSMCGKSNAQKNNMMIHVESVHFPGMFVYSCKFCPKTLNTKKALYGHV